MIHGGNGSIGCIAIGDEAIEKLFVLAYKTGISNIQLIITPSDPRTKALELNGPKWTKELYNEITYKLSKYPQPAEKISTGKRDRHQKTSIIITISVILVIFAFTAISYLKYNPYLLTASTIMTILISIYIIQNLLKLLINGPNMRREIFDISGYWQLIEYLPITIIFAMLSVYFAKYNKRRRYAGIISTALLLITLQHFMLLNSVNRIDVATTASAMLISSVIVIIGCKKAVSTDYSLKSKES
jgi:hypothetical protein